jgi:DNA-binding transcriptional LysR family regulator
MSLSSQNLDAFAEVAKTGSFSRAASRLHITQSALSQRVLNLESDLSTTLIIRDPANLRLTPAGEELLRYHQAKTSLETETLARILGSMSDIGGSVRIGSFSSLTRSVVMPAVSALVKSHQNIHVEILTREVGELRGALARNQVDFILTISEQQKQDIESEMVGFEENVLVESTKFKSVPDVYFDHDPEDETTTTFFRQQKINPGLTLRRAYLDEVYAIIDAVELGWGRAVLPKHLIRDRKNIRIVKDYRPIKSPIYLSRYRQNYYSKLHQMIWKNLIDNMPQHLL